MDVPTILFTIPEKRSDPTQYTAAWARKAVQVAKDLGYKINVLEGNKTTHANVTKILEDDTDNSIKLIVHYGHGCEASIQGNKECVINRNYSLQEIIEMYYSGCPQKIKIASRILDPMGYLANSYIYQLLKDKDPCLDTCYFDSNYQLLRGRIVFATACFAASGLGESAVEAGARSYTGSSDLYLFPVDQMGSQELYEYIQLIGLKELLYGHTVGDAETVMSAVEDPIISRFKPIRPYVSLTMLWNKMYRRVIGDWNATIFG